MTTSTLQRYLRIYASALELLVAIPLSVPFIALGWLAIMAGRFAEASLLVSHIPFYVGEHVRYLYYRATLEHVGSRVTFKYGSFCQQRGASIGSRVVIGYYDALGLVSIGDDVSIGGFVNITSGRHQHGIDDPTRANQPAARTRRDDPRRLRCLDRRQLRDQRQHRQPLRDRVREHGRQGRPGSLNLRRQPGAVHPGPRLTVARVTVRGGSRAPAVWDPD